MDSLFNSVHGTLAYLLIGQIIVVTGLFLIFLGMVAKRVRAQAEAPALIPTETPSSLTESAVLTASVPVLSAQAAIPVVPAPSPVANTSVGTTETPPTHKSIPLSIVSESAANNDETMDLAEKVKFLESKLLEYEILQEEISTLSSLKAENEQLKQKLMGSSTASLPNQSNEAVADKTLTTPAADETEIQAPAAAEAPIPVEATIHNAIESHLREPTFSETTNEAANAILKEFSEPLPTPAPVAPPIAPAAEAPEPTADNSPTLASLESLLHQIDELTKQSTDLTR